MRVLLTNCSSLAGIGGGQTAYRNLLINNPKIDLTILESSRQSLNNKNDAYKNIKIVLVKKYLNKNDILISKGFKKFTKHVSSILNEDIDDYVTARNIAETVRGMTFDIIDVPDYETFSRFLPSALSDVGVSYGKIVLSLHGRVSTTLSYEWDYLKSKKSRQELKSSIKKEDEVFSNADIRYGLSDFYKRTLIDRINLPVNIINPFSCINIPSISKNKIKTNTLPACNFIGRLERLKGIEAYIDLLWSLNKPKLYSSAEIIGEDRKIKSGFVSNLIRNIAKRRNIKIKYSGSKIPRKMQLHMENHPIVGCLPSIYDTFNLVGLELLLWGHPVIIGKNTGCYEFLKKEYPNLIGYSAIDCSLPSLSSSKLNEFLKNYHDIRKEILKFFKENKPELDKDELYSIYANSKAEYNSNIRNSISMRFCGYKSMEKYSCLKSLSRNQFEKIAKSPFIDSFKTEIAKYKSLITNQIPKYQLYFKKNLQKIFPYLYQNKKTLKNYQKLLNKYSFLKEDTEKNILIKIKWCFYFYAMWRYSNRFSIYRELSRLHDKFRYNELSITYLLRSMLIPINLSIDQKDSVVQKLKSIGMHHEAKVANIKYGDNSSEDIYNYLNERYNKLKDPPINKFSDYLDNRSSQKIRVSIIVSVYNPKEEILKRFIRLLSEFHMIKSNEVEIIIIDSGSDLPLCQNTSFLSGLKNLNYLLARTSERETIQSAWNRGIVESKSPYLVFLGVDETIRNDALNILADFLDKNPNKNWVMSNSIATAVNENGIFLEDSMFYDRKRFSRSATLFDCTFLSYVGGMYRKSLHDNHGYYDESFNGAGDTEFKCRLFPYIKPAYIPETLGIFLDYPVARKTASSKIEIEDSRAWYIFRTKGGLKYLFKNENIEAIEDLVLFCLSGKRSYTSHISESDCVTANIGLSLIKDLGGKSLLLKYKDSLEELVKAIYESEFFYNASSNNLKKSKILSNKARLFFKLLAKDFPSNNFPEDIFTDSHFFAHGWLWPISDIDKVSNKLFPF